MPSWATALRWQVGLVGAGMLSVLVFPTLGLALQGKSAASEGEMAGVIDG